MNTTTPTPLRVYVHGGTATLVTPDGTIERFEAHGDADVRRDVISRASQLARQHGHTIALTTSGDRGEHVLEIAPDGNIRPLHPEATTGAEDRLAGDRIPSAGAAADSTRAATPVTSAEPSAAMPRVVERVSFVGSDSDAALIPSTGFWRVMRRIGLVSSPSRAEVDRYREVRDVSAHWVGPHTIAVANGKGGVGKTPTTAMLAAVYARHGGGQVLAFDNNDTRGTLGWRTETSPHHATITDLLHAAPAVADAPVTALDGFVHHQAEDRYDVLQSNPRLLSAEQRLSKDEFDQLVGAVLRRYRLVVFDSGNDESADRWLRMIDWAQQLVVPTLAASPESAESAALLLEALRGRDTRSATLAADAVVIITHEEPGSRARTDELTRTFQGLARAVVHIPFDPALRSGPLRFGMVRPATQQAWIHAAATIVERFT